MSRPTAYTDVADALDGDNPVDVRIAMDYAHRGRWATLRRETQDAQGRVRLQRFARASQQRGQMSLRAEVGLYRDLMVFLGVPFVLEDRRVLRPTDLARASGLVDEQDSEANWHSRVRDGVPHIELGAAWGVLNQYRRPGLPTVVLRGATEISTGRAMEPCMRGGDCFRGVGRGTLGMSGEVRFSYRYRYAEPYCGFAVGRTVVTTGDRNFWPAGHLQGDLDREPPTTAGLTVGVALMPWEARHRFQRLALDLRFGATFVSRGREYTSLFDVLGTSSHERLADGGQRPFAGSEVDSAPFTGMTVADAHARLSGEVTLRIQAARYVRFELGIGLFAETPHWLTGAWPCDGRLLYSDQGQVTCEEGTLNPAFRPLVDRPGYRFQVSDVLGLVSGLSAQATF